MLMMEKLGARVSQAGSVVDIAHSLGLQVQTV